MVMVMETHWLHIILYATTTATLFFTHYYVLAITTSINTDEAALLAFKSHLAPLNPYSILVTNWSTASPVCSWAGVTCGSRHNRVTELDISNMQLVGTLPPHLGNLSFLTSLAAANNSFRGSLPAELSRLRRLRVLDLINNNLDGPFPEFLHILPKLFWLSLARNKFWGSLPDSISNMTTLEILELQRNNLRGNIPRDLSRLENLKMLDLQTNGFTGPIPPSIFNISTLQIVAVSENRLSGELPGEMCRHSRNLEGLYLFSNSLSGKIPSSIGNCSRLQVLDLGKNNFTGRIPHEIGNLTLLMWFGVGSNLLGASASAPASSSSWSELSFINSLTKCRNLQFLDIGYNFWDAALPPSVGNFSVYLQHFLASQCMLKGAIRKEIGKLSNLIELNLNDNQLTGAIPDTIKGLESIQQLYIHGNRLTGLVPSDAFCQLKSLYSLSLNDNQFHGPLPECLGSLPSLRVLYLSSNRFTSLPTSMWSHSTLEVLYASSNHLNGPLPSKIGNLKVLAEIDLSMNNFSGTIPDTIGGLGSISFLSFADNKLQGPIPEALSKLGSLEDLDLSINAFTGEIPQTFQDLKYLDYFNVSFNKLTGEIPNGGRFPNFTSQSFIGNEALCGSSHFQVPPCVDHTSSTSTSRKKRIYTLSGIILAAMTMILASSLVFFLRRKRKNRAPPSQLNSLIVTVHERVSFYELQEATNGFSEGNFLGKGGYGTVYKGTLRNGTEVAVKVFDMQLEGSARSFDIECKALRNLRHRNLTRVITSCSNGDDFKSLVMEYMPNGSLEKWLYSGNYFLEMVRRLNIMIDVASALEYLHDGQTMPVAHCDLRPSNVLLDEDMVGHVSDFGIAKLLDGESSVVRTKTLATIGYMAPEYGHEGLVSTKCDVYSFGIKLMETFTRVKPSDEMFIEEFNLRSWINELVHNNSIINAIDANLFEGEDDEHNNNNNNVERKIECILSIMELALQCTSTLPKERLDMKHVADALKKIRMRL